MQICCEAACIHEQEAKRTKAVCFTERGRMMIAFSDKHKRIFKLMITTAAVYLSFKYLLPLFLPFLIAYFFAWMLRPFAAWLNRKLHIPIFIGGGIGLVFLLLIIGTAVFFIGRMLLEQLTLFLKNIPVYLSYLERQFGGICDGCDKLFELEAGTVLKYMTTGIEGVYTKIQSEFLPAVTGKTLQIIMGLAVLGGTLIIIVVAALLWIKDMQEYKAGLRKSIYYPEVHRITKKLSETGIAYIKTQGIVIGMIAVLCVLALYITGNPYALIVGAGIAVFDAFPVLGSGMILIPWSIISFISKDFFTGAVLITLYLLCQVVREIIEPRLLGNKLGISPIVSLMSMFIGVKLFGLFGFFLGPLAVVVVRTVLYDEKDIQDLVKTRADLT